MDRGLPYPSVMARRAPQQDEEGVASSTAKVLGENLAALMAAHPELNSNPKLAAKTRLGTGTISRLRNGMVDANLDTLERMATAFGVAPWQLLVPGIDPTNPPTLQPVSERERRFYERLRDVLKEEL